MSSIRRPSRSALHLPGITVALGLALAFALLLPRPAQAQTAEVRVVSDASGHRLQVDGEDFMVLGMNWDYFPIGTTTNYSLWTQPDEVIRAALDREMALLRAMGVNTIRQYVGIPPRWVRYIYEEFGIWTVLNHPLGRYGVTVDGVYVANTDYSDPATRETILNEIEVLVDEFEGVPGILMWLLGNENNYGLVWESAETQDLPEGEADTVRARYLYSLFGEAVDLIKSRDDRLVSMANGDLQYLDIIAEEVPNLDVMGSNVYRGISARDFFQRIEETLGLPAMFTEFGADAFNARELREDQVSQARYLLGQWQEIYEQSAGKGRVGNAVGGLTFQWSDGWWKFGQDSRLDIQDTNASWANDAYPDDFVEGENNMNEEWWGIVAKGPADSRGLFELYPRAAYYALEEAYELDPYAPDTDLEAIREHFDDIDAEEAALEARGDRAGLIAGALDRFHVDGLRMEWETFSTGGSSITTPESRPEVPESFPAFQGFDQLQSFYVDVAARPVPNVQGNFSVNILGDVPTNPIDEIFYENRGRPVVVEGADGSDVTLNDVERLKVYSASISWQDRWFNMEGFYRSGHYHWGYEGDFFNLYREANYGPNLDLYNGIAPVGVEFEGKRALEGLHLAFGPQLWWGANPAIMARYTRPVGAFTVTGVVQEDFSRQSSVATSIAIPERRDRKATLHITTTRGPAVFDVGGIWAGDPFVGETFQVVDGEPGSYRVLQDQVKTEDTFGGRAKITVDQGRLKWYVEGSAMGLVADGGYDQTQTFTGWSLKDTGSGNRWSVLGGFAWQSGDWQLAPNFMWQKPIVGPVPADAPQPARPRNILDDPFAVRGGNRETTAGELRITYDPTPATWMYTWDSDVMEDAPFAASLGFVYRSFATTQDAAIGIAADGRTTFPFPGATPARDLWEVNARLVAKQGPREGWIANLYGGTAEPNGDDPRLVERFGTDVRHIRGPVKVSGAVRVNDWGPYDYHRDFNLTFPLQLEADLSYSLGLPGWFDLPGTRFGIRGTWRTLDENSPRYCPARVADPLTGSLVCDPGAPGDDGREWEIRTYVHFGM